jgi:hypothetical protein
MPYVPGAHSTGSALPPAQKVPALQGTQLGPLVPAKHELSPADPPSPGAPAALAPPAPPDEVPPLGVMTGSPAAPASAVSAPAAPPPAEPTATLSLPLHPAKMDTARLANANGTTTRRLTCDM